MAAGLLQVHFAVIAMGSFNGGVFEGVFLAQGISRTEEVGRRFVLELQGFFFKLLEIALVGFLIASLRVVDDRIVRREDLVHDGLAVGVRMTQHLRFEVEHDAARINRDRLLFEHLPGLAGHAAKLHHRTALVRVGELHALLAHHEDLFVVGLLPLGRAQLDQGLVQFESAFGELVVFVLKANGAACVHADHDGADHAACGNGGEADEERLAPGPGVLLALLSERFERFAHLAVDAVDEALVKEPHVALMNRIGHVNAFAV